MAGPGDYHTKRSKSKNDKYPLIPPYVKSKNDTNEHIYKTETDSQIEKRLGDAKVGRRGWGKEGLEV